MKFRSLTCLLLLGACADVSEPSEARNEQAITERLSRPTLRVITETASTIRIELCAGSTGAPEGFAVRWAPTGGSACAIASRTSLGPGACASLVVGNDPPEPDDVFHDPPEPDDVFHDPPEPEIVSHDPPEPEFVFHDPPEPEAVLGSCNPMACGTEVSLRAFARGSSAYVSSDLSPVLVGRTASCDGTSTPQ